MAGILQTPLLLYCCRAINQNFQTNNVEKDESNGSSVDQVVFRIYRHVFWNKFKRFLNAWILKGRDRYGSNVGKRKETISETVTGI